jgi:mono/diheme cytochrome c family protein
VRRATLALLLVLGQTMVHAETPAERGAYLVRGPMGCGNCHTPMGPAGFIADQELGGRLVQELPEFTAYAPNITPASEIAGWSDADLARAIREGIRPDGSLIGPPMPIGMYRGLSDTDVNAIVAFLRTLRAVENEVPESTYNIPLPPSYGPPVGHVPDVPHGATAEYGAYLAGPVAHCLECHTPMGPNGFMLDTDLGRGGFVFDGPWGRSVSANITNGPDGLAEYTDDQIKAMITEGKHADGTPMMPPMPYPFLAKMTPEDLDAIVRYLRTLPYLPDRS